MATLKTKAVPVMSLHLRNTDSIRLTAVMIEDVSMPVPIIGGCPLCPGESIVIANVDGVLKVTAHVEDDD